MLLALALVSVAMYAIAKLSPYETEDLGRYTNINLLNGLLP